MTNLPLWERRFWEICVALLFLDIVKINFVFCVWKNHKTPLVLPVSKFNFFESLSKFEAVEKNIPDEKID